MVPQTLYYGDCLDWMRKWPSECVDLIYLDPPFNSNTDYNILFGTENNVPAQLRAFTDTWNWDEKAAERTEAILNAVGHPVHAVTQGLYHILGESGMLAYLTYMAERLVEMHRILKPTGSIYLHCDPFASHYLKIVMDAIFGKSNFRNEIVWRIGWVSGFKTQKRGWIRNHDILLYYTMSKKANERFNKEYIPYPDGYTRRDGDKPTGKGIPIEDTWNCSEKDILDSIMIKSFSVEKLGYPTQKPRSLLERIIKASSNPGDIVLDPFAGCGTTIDAAQRLGRRWIGVDISSFAIDLVQEYRLKPLGVTAHIEGIPADLASARRLAEANRFDFESWAIYLVPGLVPNKRQTGDGGIDGRGKMLVKPENVASQLVLAQVKSGHFSLSQFRDFMGVLGTEDAALGLFITLDSVSTRDARSLIVKSGQVVVGAERYHRLDLWSIEDYFDERRPHLPPMLDPFTGKPMTQPGLPQLPAFS